MTQMLNAPSLFHISCARWPPIPSLSHRPPTHPLAPSTHPPTHPPLSTTAGRPTASPRLLQYLEKKDFLQRAELREYEQERDKRLASDMRTRGRL